MKYFLTVVLTALVVGLGVVAYFEGWLPFLTFSKPQAVSVQNTEISAVSPTPVVISAPVTPTPVASPEVNTQKVQSGGVLVFKTYSLTVPSGWNMTTSGSVPGQVNKLTLSTGSYSIVFTQAAMGGGTCVFPGDPNQPMSTTYYSYSEVTTSTGQKLRVGVLSTGDRSVCEMQNGVWSNLTEFGRIDITSPATPDQKVLDQINSVLSSIQKV